MAPKLGTLYRQYLRGSDLTGPCLVTIAGLTQVTVQPHPRSEPVEKWCLWVTGLPEDTPNGILFGPKGEEVLTKIFGEVDIKDLKGAQIIIYPLKVHVAGYDKMAVRFRLPKSK